MSLFNVFQVSQQGMTAQRERLEAAAANLANANTTRTAEGGPYRRRDVVFEAITVQDTNAGAGPATQFGSLFDDARQQAAEGVRSTTLIAAANTGIKRYQPDHPDADANGNVTVPDVDPLEETVNMLSAARSFEANATAFNTAKELARASLKLGDA